MSSPEPQFSKEITKDRKLKNAKFSPFYFLPRIAGENKAGMFFVNFAPSR
jgi:hypothetical protein